MIAVLLATINLFAQTFAGSWTCHQAIPAANGHAAHTISSEWKIAPAPGEKWTVVKWGPQDGTSGGVAYVGFVPGENDWAYQDFHYDGTYGVTTSSGPDKDGLWTWAGGGYYTPDGIMHGQVTWKASTPTRIDREFFSMVDGKAKPTGSDYCTKHS